MVVELPSEYLGVGDGFYCSFAVKGPNARIILRFGTKTSLKSETQVDYAAFRFDYRPMLQ